jgi:transcriptional regulator with XRE-family HTH domain
VDDRRLGLVIRALRRKRRWRQVDLAGAAGVSQSLVSRAEAGHVDTLTMRALRRICAALDIRLDLDTRWRAGDLDRLLDSRHAEIAGEVGRVLVDGGWLALHEVTFAIGGERGSIDLLGVRGAERIAW